MRFSVTSKPIRAVLRWQVYATLILALIAGMWAGLHGSLSALLGGFISWVAGAAYGWVGSAGRTSSEGATLRTLFRAEASKIALIVIQLWIVLTAYKDIVLVGFFSSFFIATLIFSMALFADRPSTTNEMRKPWPPAKR